MIEDEATQSTKTASMLPYPLDLVERSSRTDHHVNQWGATLPASGYGGFHQAMLQGLYLRPQKTVEIMIMLML